MCRHICDTLLIFALSRWPTHERRQPFGRSSVLSGFVCRLLSRFLEDRPVGRLGNVCFSLPDLWPKLINVYIRHFQYKLNFRRRVLFFFGSAWLSSKLVGLYTQHCQKLFYLWGKVDFAITWVEWSVKKVALGAKGSWRVFKFKVRMIREGERERGRGTEGQRGKENYKQFCRIFLKQTISVII